MTNDGDTAWTAAFEPDLRHGLRGRSRYEDEGSGSHDAQRWLDQLTTSPHLTIESLAAREGKTERWIRRTISLAFLCPGLVKAAIEGRLPRGFGVKRLMDLPMAWPNQWSALGLRAPAAPNCNPNLSRSRTSTLPRRARSACWSQPRSREPKIRRRTSFARSPAKARRPSRVNPADH